MAAGKMFAIKDKTNQFLELQRVKSLPILWQIGRIVGVEKSQSYLDVQGLMNEL